MPDLDYDQSTDPVEQLDEQSGETMEVDSNRDGHVLARRNHDVIQKIHPFSGRLLDIGGGKDMTVNGAGDPVDYTAGPPGGEVWYVTELGLLISDTGTLDITDFGAIPGALLNGLQILFDINSTGYEYVDLHDNCEISLTFGHSGPPQFPTGWLDTRDVYFGFAKLNQPVRLIGDDGDLIIGRVRDNLTGLTALAVSFKAYKII
jgi:hypothetical protein